MDKVEELKRDIQNIKEKIEECKLKNKTDHFDIEMVIMTELPELYDQYPWLIKRLSKSTDDKWLNKFVDELESVTKGNKTLAAVELSLGNELKEEFIDPVVSKLPARTRDF